VFARLVAASDAVFANFKPGTLDALGFGYPRLQELNTGLVLAQSSAYGEVGPWSTRMGYGPLVRAATGVTSLWTADTAGSDARHPFFDATTIFPDHVVGRITAIGALAALIRRRRQGVGARIGVSQAEAGINQLETRFVTLAAEASGAGAVEVHRDTAEHLVLACLGEDQWCVVSITSDADRRAIAGLVGDAALADWTALRTPGQVAEQLQAAGVPAGPMHRPDDVYEHPQLAARGVLTAVTHPLLAVPLPVETGPARYRHIPPAPQRPAPLPGADTRRICRDVLAMSDQESGRLIAEGVLFVAEERQEGVPL
jgi:crotonobetainyl-CoA:carnitine CoA-transferase CaiB-like acyl-CoA transferase